MNVVPRGQLGGSKEIIRVLTSSSHPSWMGNLMELHLFQMVEERESLAGVCKPIVILPGKIHLVPSLSPLSLTSLVVGGSVLPLPPAIILCLTGGVSHDGQPPHRLGTAGPASPRVKTMS